MAGDESRTPFIDGIVDEVLRGERIVLLPPGIAAFVLANMGFLFGTALLCAAALPPLVDPGPAARATAPLIGIGAALLSLFWPAFLVAHGHASGRKTFAAVTLGWLSLSLLALLAALVGALQVSPLVLLAATLLLASTWQITRTLAYRTFALFKQRLRVRRRELLAQRRRG